MQIYMLHSLLTGFEKIGVEVAFLNFNQRKKPLLHSIISSEAKAVFFNSGKSISNRERDTNIGTHIYTNSLSVDHEHDKGDYEE